MEEDLWEFRSELQSAAERVYITNFFGAKSLKKLEAKGISHVLVCAAELPFVFEKQLCYKRLNVADNTHVVLPFNEALDFIDSALAENERTNVLVHCAAGSSRSGAIYVAWMMRSQRIPLKMALKKTKTVRPIVLPNPGFIEQLNIYQKELGISDEQDDESA